MRKANQALPLALLLAARTSAQALTIVNNPNDPGVITSYLSICPTASSTTITLSTTTTICPGPNCGGAITWYQPRPTTTVGPDGRTTIFEEHKFTAPCPCDGGICDAVYTVTRECPCTAPHPPTIMPPGFTSTAVACHMCAQNGGPSTVTIVTPVSNGPYASQTPVMGAPYNGASATARSWAYASAGPNGAVANGGSNAAASAGNGYAAANAGSGASANANNGNSVASSNSNGDAHAQVGTPQTPSNSLGASVSVGTYHGTANRAVFAFSAIAAGVIGSLAIFL